MPDAISSRELIRREGAYEDLADAVSVLSKHPTYGPEPDDAMEQPMAVPRGIVDALAMPDTAEIEFEPPKASIQTSSDKFG
ncbi:hypothetical protein [Pseudomonas japonica]|uniref:hypothetical protein n=1 Tax=Pseudomonas japonica TaxID=256466 RepID=UPI0015E45FF9|nr:hypothetical protein [Pseudomonas japonica]MBA1245753.1 hypothetical protein [Pseudomonas japonica]